MIERFLFDYESNKVIRGFGNQEKEVYHRKLPLPIFHKFFSLLYGLYTINHPKTFLFHNLQRSGPGLYV